MKLDIKPYKGTRDIYPEDMRLRRYIFNTWREVVESYGYEEYDAPVLEPFELYAAKTGEEIVNDQTYTFVDRGERKVAIRPEMTPSVGRMIAARRQEQAYPARLYSIANFMRYEKPQKGREREFWQLNVDIFGVESIEADIEVIAIGAEILKRFGAKPEMYSIKVNDRRLINFVMSDFFELNYEKVTQMMKLFDRKNKISKDEFENQAIEIAGKGKLTQIQEVMEAKTIEDLPKEILDSGKLNDIQTVVKKLKEKNVFAEFDITLMRGFDYYTGIVFEVFDKNPNNNRSMFGGGRYDGLVGLFGVDDLPVFGFAPGETTTIEFLKTWNLIPELNPSTDLVLVEMIDGAQIIATKLRGLGVKVAEDFTGRKLDKVIKSADRNGVKWILFVGKDEMERETYKLKNLESGENLELNISEIAQTVLK